MDTDDYYDSGPYADDNDHDASPPMADMDDVEEEKDAQETLNECISKFGTPDFIMEPEIFSQLKKYFQYLSSVKLRIMSEELEKYFQAGGNPEQVIELLSINYIGKK